MSLPGKLAVNSWGGATYSVPISIPPGSAGVVPALSLEYSNQTGNGLLGVGWSLGGLPTITRCPRTQAQDGVRGGVGFDSNDRFCLDGQRLVAVSGTYGADGAEYRTEIDSYSRIVSHGTAGTGPAWFEVRSKSGQTMEFGHTGDSQILAQGKTTARTWALNKLSDAKGNYLTVSYTNDAANGQYYPIEINYTGNAAAGIAPFNKVQFVYVSRSDVVPQYIGGSGFRTSVRLTNIRSYAAGALVYDYALSYEQSPSTQRSRLTSVRACGGDGSCLPATSFGWQGQATVPGAAGFAAGWGGYALTTGDFNGDGRTDLFVCPPSAGATCYLYYVNGSTLTQSSFTANWGGYQVFAADFNGDGRSDFFVCGSGSGDPCYVLYSTGSGFQGVQVLSWGGSQTVVADYDGDGRADLLMCPQWDTNCYMFISNGTGFTNTAFKAGWRGAQIVTADFNGDGKADIYVCPQASGATCYVYYADGAGLTLSSFTANWGGQHLSFGDFNGDGLADFFICPPAGGTCYVYYSTGTSFVAGSFTANWGGYVVTAGDFNNDTLTDLMACPPTNNGDVCHLYASTGAYFAPSNFAPAWYGYQMLFGDWGGVCAASLLVFPPGAGTVGQQYITSFLPELITSVSNGLATTAIMYSPLTSSDVYSKGSGATYPTLDISGGLNVVKRLDASNGVGGNYSSTYTYDGYKADLSGRGLLGFRQIAIKDLQTGVIETTNYRQDFPFAGIVSSSSKTLGIQTLSQSSNTFAFSNASGGTTVSPASAPYRVWLSQNVSSSKDLDGTTLPTVTTGYQYDGYGNPTQVSASTSDGFSKTTVNSYVNDTGNWFLGRLTGASVTSVAP
ncbi:hypothetical protein DB459_21285 [Bradyrhizobium sp. WD16]|nr:hypothetical protein DB459_21285 [Bradyrhizobium sp. WD16]